MHLLYMDSIRYFVSSSKVLLLLLSSLNVTHLLILFQYTIMFDHKQLTCRRIESHMSCIVFRNCCLYNLWIKQFLRIARSLHLEVGINMNNIFILILALSFLTPSNLTILNCNVQLLVLMHCSMWILCYDSHEYHFRQNVLLAFFLREFRVQEGKVVIPLGVTVHGDVVVSVYHMRSTIGGRLQAKVWIDVSFKCKIEHSGWSKIF